MSEQNESQAGQTAQFSLHRIYLKDLSFESPRAIEALGKRIESPEINLQLNTEVQKVEDDHFEVTLNITATAREKGADEVLYLVELKQAGLFSLTNFPQKELAAMLNSYCPAVLFPYAREALSSMVERGGFPQLLLAPLNFDALYQQHVARQADAGQPPSKH